MKKHNNCDGCRDFKSIIEGENYDCIKWNYDKSCSCTLCIVKMVCRESCEKWKDWWYARYKPT